MKLSAAPKPTLSVYANVVCWMYQTTVTVEFCGPPFVRMLTESKS